jgi:hypothetical protein
MAPKARSNLVPYYASEIKQRWQKVLESIFAVADLLIEAKQKLDPRDWEDLKDELPFSDSVAEKLLLIGGDKRLRKVRVYELLPSSYSTIYEITELNDEELRVAVKDGQISTRMRREAFIDWREQWRNAHGASSARGLSRLRIGVLGLYVFAEVLTDGSISSRKTIQLTQELDRIAKQYGVRVDYSKNEHGEARKAQAELTRELQEKLQALIAPYNANVDEKELRLIDNALWQHRALETGEAPKYAPNDAHSVQNKDHPYSIQAGWDSKSILKKMNERRIITTRIPIKDREELEEAHCLQLAIWYLETSNVLERRKHKRALQRIARAKSKDSKTAESCLEQIVPFERVGLQ